MFTVYFKRALIAEICVQNVASMPTAASLFKVLQVWHICFMSSKYAKRSKYFKSSKYDESGRGRRSTFEPLTGFLASAVTRLACPDPLIILPNMPTLQCNEGELFNVHGRWVRVLDQRGFSCHSLSDLDLYISSQR